MESALRTIVLLLLCIHAAPAQLQAQPLDSVTVTLNITIFIPPRGNDDTRFTIASLGELDNHAVLTVEAQRPGQKSPCDDTSTVSSLSANSSCAAPELCVRVIKQTQSGNSLICSADIYDQVLQATIDTESQQIITIANRTSESTNTATAIITILTTHLSGLSFSKSSTCVSFIANVAQTWTPTTTNVPTTNVPTTTTTTTTAATTTAATKTETTTTQRPVAPKTPARVIKPSKVAQTSLGESTLCRGPMTGLILLILVPALLLLN